MAGKSPVEEKMRMGSQKTVANMQLLMDSWLDGAVRSYGYIAGSDTLKNFLKGAAEVTVAHIREEAENRGIAVEEQPSPEKAIQHMAEVETALDLWDTDHLTTKQEGDEITIEMHGCPYASVCTGILSDMIGMSMSQGFLPCFRAEMYQAALASDTGAKSRYVLKQYAPGVHCTAIIELI
jgi:hypothetical protein